MPLFVDDIRVRLANARQTRGGAPRYRFTLFLLDRLFDAIVDARDHPDDLDLIQGCDSFYGVLDYMAMLSRSIFTGHLATCPDYLKRE